MPAGKFRARPRLGGEDGFTLVELLTAMAISLVVAAGALVLLEISAPQADRELQREVAISEGRSGVERMLREIRNADIVNATSPTMIDVNTPTASGSSASSTSATPPSRPFSTASACVTPGRSAAPSPTAQVVVERLINGTTSQPVFTYVPDRIRPEVVRAQVVLPASGGPAPGYMHRIVLRDAAFLRNLDLTGG